MIPHSLQTHFQNAWAQIEAAVTNATHPYRTTCLATVDSAGRPENRMVVIRGASHQHRRLTVYSDGAALKCRAIESVPTAAFCFWDAKSRTQVRMIGAVRLVKGEALNLDWNTQGPSQKDLYRIAPKPGTVIPNANAYDFGSQTRFTRFDCSVQSVDILSLSKPNHTRLHAKWSQDQWLLNWVTP
jgi:pyridoxamine 5'-phosphate oxidase